MSQEEKGSDQRAPGARVNARYSVTVTWAAADDESVHEGRGRVINVGPAGALLQLDAAPPTGQEVFVHLAPAGEMQVAEDNQVSFRAKTLWTAPAEGGETKAAFELNLKEASGHAYMRRWMELIYEPVAINDALEG